VLTGLVWPRMGANEHSNEPEPKGSIKGVELLD
jgi:hypothetical protein